MSTNFTPYATSPKSGTRSRHIGEKDGDFALAAGDLEASGIDYSKDTKAMLGHKRGGKGRTPEQVPGSFGFNK